MGSKSALAAIVLRMRGFLRDLLRPIPKLQVWEWAEQNIYLDERSSATPGRFSTKLTPYIREPLQCYADKSVRDLALCFGTQTAKTTIVMVGTAYKIVNDPMNCLWVMPSLELARSFSKNRWLPMVDNCAPLREQKPLGPNGRLNRHLFGFLEQAFLKVTLNFVGSNSAAQLASRPAGLLNMDETDKFKLDDDREAGALQLAEERTKTFSYPLRVKTSTPTTVHGEIWREFLAGDQRYYFVPCPHCEKMIQLKFRVKTDEHGECGLRWWRESEDESKVERVIIDESGAEKTVKVWDPAKVKRNAFYKCQQCGGEILDSQKPDMLEAGEWVPTNAAADRSRRSYHLSTLYSLLGSECTFGMIAIRWLETKGSLSKRHNFINSTLAETWDDERAVDDAPIFTESFEEDGLPSGRTKFMGVDCQEGHYWVVVRSYAPGGESWLHFAGRIETIEEVTQIQKEHGVEGRYVCIDMAHYTNRVAKYCVENDWRGFWGSDKRQFMHTLVTGQRVHRVWSPVQHRDPMLGTTFAAPMNKRAQYVYWANDPVKDLLEVLRHMEPCRFHVHSTVPKEYVRHMSAEIKTTKRSFQTGRITYYWKKLRQDDHCRDCECMILVRAVQAGLVPTPDEDQASFQRAFSFDDR